MKCLANDGKDSFIFRDRDAIILAIVAIVLSITSAKAELKVDITRGTVKALPIAVANFVGTNKKGSGIGEEYYLCN